MEEHTRALLQRFQHSEQFKETAAFRIVFGGEPPSQVMAGLDMHNSYTLRNWVSLYQRKVQTGLFVSPAMTQTQKRDVQALKQRSGELEEALQQANLLILALHTIIEVAAGIPTTHPKKVWYQMVRRLQENEIVRVRVGHLCRLVGSRQAFCHRQHYAQRVRGHSLLVLDLVLALRREIPGLGTRKLHLLLQQPPAESGIHMGRDKRHRLLQIHDSILRQKRLVPKTTNSAHCLRRYSSLLVDIALTAPQQAWVCNIMYLCIGLGFGHLSLLTDAYSKLISAIAGIRCSRWRAR